MNIFQMFVKHKATSIMSSILFPHWQLASAHQGRENTSNHILPYHLAAFRWNRLLALMPAVLFGKDGYSETSGHSMGWKTEERIDRRYIIYLQDSASDIPKGEPTAKRHRGTGCSCADGPLQTIQDPMSRATHMLVNVDHLRQVEVKTQMLWLLLLHQTSLAPALPKEVMLPLAKWSSPRGLKNWQGGRR